MIFPRSLMVEYKDDESFVEWIQQSRTSSGKISTLCDRKGHRVEDTRVGPWLKFPLSRFIQPLVDTRNKYKNEMKHSSEYKRKDAMQRSIKGGVNTLYGTMASADFAPAGAPHHALLTTSRIWLVEPAG